MEEVARRYAGGLGQTTGPARTGLSLSRTAGTVAGPVLHAGRNATDCAGVADVLRECQEPGHIRGPESEPDLHTSSKPDAGLSVGIQRDDWQDVGCRPARQPGHAGTGRRYQA